MQLASQPMGGSAGAARAEAVQADEVERLFDRGLTWDQFLTGATAQRDAWRKTTADATLSPDMVERFKRASAGLRVLIVAEDWCPDSVNVVPYIAALASSVSAPRGAFARPMTSTRLHVERNITSSRSGCAVRRARTSGRISEPIAKRSRTSTGAVLWDSPITTTGRLKERSPWSP